MSSRGTRFLAIGLRNMFGLSLDTSDWPCFANTTVSGRGQFAMSVPLFNGIQLPLSSQVNLRQLQSVRIFACYAYLKYHCISYSMMTPWTLVQILGINKVIVTKRTVVQSVMTKKRLSPGFLVSTVLRSV